MVEPPRGPAAEPLIRGQWAKPTEAQQRFFAFVQLVVEKLANLS